MVIYVPLKTVCCLLTEVLMVRASPLLPTSKSTTSVVGLDGESFDFELMIMGGGVTFYDTVGSDEGMD
jgi:hypothetical protein